MHFSPFAVVLLAVGIYTANGFNIRATEKIDGEMKVYMIKEAPGSEA